MTVDLIEKENGDFIVLVDSVEKRTIEKYFHENKKEHENRAVAIFEKILQETNSIEKDNVPVAGL